ncbi:MAG: hypothetical protein D6776_10295 [Planctomycetota bacterium]|nr:MAG: hypothetical protein D6776_10295 [Planctomycetota bacterium]
MHEPAAAESRSRGRDRLVVVDMGELRTRAEGFAVEPGGLQPVGRLELESAVCPGDLPARAGARRGMDSVGGRLEPPLVVAHPERAEQLLLVGAPAATLGGYRALLAAEPTRERVEALLHAAIGPFVRPGDRVRLVVVDGPSAVADRLREGPARWRATPIELRVFEPWRAALGHCPITVTTHFLPAGEVFTELAYERAWIREGAPPVVVLDVGHKTSRLYIASFFEGLLDLEIIPHGGIRLLEHARRYAAQRGWQTGGDVALLRQLDAGTEMLTFGGMSFVTREFFVLPRQDLEKALCAGIAERLRRHMERGGAWPRALLVAGGGAESFAPAIGLRLAQRGLAIGEVRALRARPSPLIAGALGAVARRAALSAA